MVIEAVGKNLIFNGDVEKCEDTEAFSSISDNSVYAVLNIYNSFPLFYEDHLKRIEDTFKASGRELKVSLDNILDDILKLIKLNEIEKSLIKVVISDENYVVYEFWDRMPTDDDIKNGVKASIFDYERENPNQKILRSNYKSEVSKYLMETNSFEVILRTEDGELLEGGRSNLFFTMKDKVITAPDERVLKGITRKKINEVFSNLGIEVENRIIHDYELIEIDGAFFTGSTVEVTPIKYIESIELDSAENELIKSVIEGYENLKKEYVDDHKKAL